MRERSHEKGKSYQRDVKRLLAGTYLFGAPTHPYGDAYDLTSSLAVLGGKQFDISLALRDKEDEHRTVGVIYVECKFKGRKQRSSTTSFKEFLKDVASACKKAGPESWQHAKFLFVSTIPPASWGDFLRDATRHLRDVAPDELAEFTDDDVATLAASIAVLVLTAALLGGTY